MPRIPRLNSATSAPQTGSVGRQRINAPIEAFGGGAAAGGLASVGKGLADLGQGIQREAKNREAEEEDARKKDEKFKSDRGKLGYSNERIRQITKKAEKKLLENSSTKKLLQKYL